MFEFIETPFFTKALSLTIYGKNVREDIPAHSLRQMKENIDDA